MSNLKTEEYLNDLLAKTYDAQRGFANAAENTNHVQLKRWLADKGARRTEFAAQIINEMKGMNQKPEMDGTMKGDMHRSWMNIKTALSLNNDEAILEECIRGEKAAVDGYQEVLEHSNELAPTLTQTLKSQKDEIQMTLSNIRTLEDIADKHDY
ncbi:MAG: PA2169 family four-helix-bundle protein [Nonlabens sp.]